MSVVARCTITGAVHGYMFEGELVQSADGALARRNRDDFGPPLDKVPFEAVEPAFDLRAELERLRGAPPIVRPMTRFVRIEVRAGNDIATFSYPRPMKGDVQTDHPADRLFAAVWAGRLKARAACPSRSPSRPAC